MIINKDRSAYSLTITYYGYNYLSCPSDRRIPYRRGALARSVPQAYTAYAPRSDGRLPAPLYRRRPFAHCRARTRTRAQRVGRPHHVARYFGGVVSPYQRCFALLAPTRRLPRYDGKVQHATCFQTLGPSTSGFRCVPCLQRVCGLRARCCRRLNNQRTIFRKSGVTAVFSIHRRCSSF